MEKNQYLIKSFLSDSCVDQILSWVDTIDHHQECYDHHVGEIAKSLNGKSFMLDLSKTDLTKFITLEQSGGNVVPVEAPAIISDLVGEISEKIKIPSEDVFLQVLDMKKGGEIKPHYDASVSGFINFKCNVSVVSEDYSISIERNILNISQKDLYCFEASLYKHWTTLPFTSRRVLLSFGFMLPISVLQRSENDPRVRMSNRIQKYFQKNKL